MANQKEIARLANVSQSVVSRVMTNHAKDFGIADATIERVRLIAKSLNYRPNPAARMLLGHSTRLIGVVVKSFDSEFLGRILEELNARALEAGHALLVVGQGHSEYNATEVHLLESYRPDAFIVLGTTDFSEWKKDFVNGDRFIIQIGMPNAHPGVVTCGINEEAAAKMMVDHLVSLGHRRIGCVGEGSISSRLRLEYLAREVARRSEGVELVTAYICESPSIPAGEAAAGHYLFHLQREAWPTAVIVTGDLVALSFIHSLMRAGVQVPQALSVASYNDIQLSVVVPPRLTTIRWSARDIASRAIAMVQGKVERVSTTVLPELVVRESTAKVAG